jgi:hypothetical protein
MDAYTIYPATSEKTASTSCLSIWVCGSGERIWLAMEGIVLVLIIVGAFVLVDVLLTALAVKRFQRSKLILD